MSADNHDQSKITTIKPTRVIHNAADETAATFDTKRIKKERHDVTLDNGPPGEGTLADTRTHRASSAAAGHHRITNGFHSNDNLQDILTNRITALSHHGPAVKNDKIRLMIEDSISDDSKARVQEIFSQVEQLKLDEKLLLYLKLPLSLSNPAGTIDPLRQPLNPLGNRYEIHQTIMWIKTHLEEDPEVSLPKQEVYDEYQGFCVRNSMKPLSTADFGKVMKQVYPRVRPRRLGTRGNSRYCYAGMRKKIKLDPPTLPAITDTPSNEDTENNTEEMLGAASTLIREWAENLLGLKFSSLSALARHLVDNLCVDTKSLAAVCILWASGDQSSANKEIKSNNQSVIPVAGKPGRPREVQLQLQRKLQQREHTRDQKQKHLDAAIQTPIKEKTVENYKSGGGGSKGTRKSSKTTSQSPQSTTSTSPDQNTLTVKQTILSTITTTSMTMTTTTTTSTMTARQKKILKNNIQQQQQQQQQQAPPCKNISPRSNCDNNKVVQSVEEVKVPKTNESNVAIAAGNRNCVVSTRETKTKVNTRKRANSTAVLLQSSDSSPEKQAKIVEAVFSSSNNNSTSQIRLNANQRGNNKMSTAVILTSNVKSPKSKTTEAIIINRPAKNCDNNYTNPPIKSNGCQNVIHGNEDPTDVLTKDQIRLLQETQSSYSDLLSKNDKLCTIDPDSLDDYLNGGNNSQEQEEELLQYFQQSSSSSSDAEVNNALPTDTEQISRLDQVSQLRLILQQNFKTSAARSPAEPEASNNTTGPNVSESKDEQTQKHNLILPTLLNHTNPAQNRRRVSFETNVDVYGQESTNLVNTVPQSPNTRRRIFNFTPISPGPHSPINGRASKSSSANASPFVSPRNTPVPRSRSNVQSSAGRSRVSQKNLSRPISCSVPFVRSSDNFIVPTSGTDTRLMSAPPSPLTCTKTSDVQVGTTFICAPPKQERQTCNNTTTTTTTTTSTFLPSDLSTQDQLLINYPSHENLQEIKNVYQKNQPTDHEISELFLSNKHCTTEQLCSRSQSVPLRRMADPNLMSPISSQTCLMNFQSQSFNPSSSSSIAPTPVPSEFNDFSSIGRSDSNTYLLDEVDANFISDDQQFLIGEKGIMPENITNILKILTDEQPILTESTDEVGLIENSDIILDTLPNSSLNLSEASMLDPGVLVAGNTLQKIIHSRSYPNTPLPPPVSTYTASYTEDSNGSRSYPSTPLHTVQQQQQQQQRESYLESNEPMLSSPTLNSLNLHNESTSTNPSSNVADLLETNFLTGDADNETDDLDPLANFDGLQDVESLTPLFTEVAEPNR